MMVRTQVSIDERLSDALDELSDEEREDRTALIRGAVDRLVLLSGQTAAQALLAWSAEFARPLGGNGARDHDQILGDMDEW